MSSKKISVFRRKGPQEIMTERVERDRYIVAFSAMLFVDIATSVIFPIVDLTRYLSKEAGISVRDLMSVTLGYALICSVTVGTLTALMALFRLRAINVNPSIRAKRLYQTGFHTAIVITVLMFIFWLIV